MNVSERTITYENTDMIPEPFTQIGLMCAIIAVILDKTLPLIQKKNGNDPHKRMQDDMTAAKQQLTRLELDLSSIKRYTGELHRWHDKEDEDGVKIWYIRSSLERAIHKLAEAADAQTRLMEKVINDLDEMKKRQP